MVSIGYRVASAGFCVCLVVLFSMRLCLAAIDAYEFDSKEQERRFRQLIAELRCPKCQNQNISGSDAPLAADLRQKVHSMILDRQSDEQIIDYMVQRYGDFITYRPPLRPLTWILWFGPAIIIIGIGLILAGWIIRRASAQQSQRTRLSEAERERLAELLQDKTEK